MQITPIILSVLVVAMLVLGEILRPKNTIQLMYDDVLKEREEEKRGILQIRLPDPEKTAREISDSGGIVAYLNRE